MAFFHVGDFSSRPFHFPSPTSPFCTSPSQLQEVTLDQDNTFSNSMGMRSPGGLMRGKSVKEFEEQLANLKKENFNLKLRIYFLEERMGVNFNLDKENIMKKNVELLVDVESLRKELQEKHDLLCQAVKAMELEDEEHKKVLNERNEVIAECQQEIENLKIQIIDFKAETEVLNSKSFQSTGTEFHSAHNLEDTSSTLKVNQERILSLEEELDQEKENTAAIQILLDQRDAKINQLMTELEEANKSVTLRELEMQDKNFRLEEAQGRWQGLDKKLQEKTHHVDELSSENKELRKLQNLINTELEKERKRYEKLKAGSEQKIAELQCKLEASLAELKKSQELVVSKSSPRRSSGNTDPDSFSVQKPTALVGSPQKDTFFLPTVPTSVVTPSSSSLPSSPIDDCPSDPKQLKVERDVLHQKVVKLKAEQMKACKIIKNMIEARNKYNEEMTILKQKNEELERELEGVVSQQRVGVKDKEEKVTSNENSMAEESGELLQHYKILTDELDEKNRILMATLKEKDNQMKIIQVQYEEMLSDVQRKEAQIIDLEFEMLSLGQDNDETGGNRSVDFYIRQLQEKNDEIEKLNSKLLKKNCDLQGLVNNELWEKNREIEKLHNKQTSMLLEDKEQEIRQLKNELGTKEKHFCLVKEKISELGLELDIAGDNVNVENVLQMELEKSEKLRAEANEVCAVLSKRLEELAIFLDNLLKQKSVLGFLGNKENKRLRQIIDESLNLSQSFIMSLMINPEQSLLQLTNISSLWNEESQMDEDIPEQNESRLVANTSLTYHSHLSKKTEDSSQIIQTLRQQIVNLKYELQLRDREMEEKINVDKNFTEPSSEKENEVKGCLNTTSTTLKYKSDNQSDSEAWSEPDRNVSKARLGLVDISLNNRKKSLIQSSESTEDEEFERRHIPFRHSELKNDMSLSLILADNTAQKNEIANLRTQLEEMAERVREAETKKEFAERKVKELELAKGELLEIISKKDKEMQDRVNLIEVEKTQYQKIVKEAEESAIKAKNEMKIAEEKIRNTQTHMDEMKENLRLEYQEEIQRVTEESLKRISEVRSSTEVEICLLQRTLKELEIEYASNYIKKSELEDAVYEVERLHREVGGVTDCLTETKEELEEVITKLSECEERNNALRNDLDNATLQYSEAVLEKTKISNEKAFLEQELNKSSLKEVELKINLDQVESKLYNLKQIHEKQVSVLNEEKSKLEYRISELESSNAELHNRLVKIQTGCGDNASSASNANNFVNQIVSLGRQNADNFEYLGEENALIVNNGNFNRNLDVERNEANSSPDLGIESDHGRFSSLETQLQMHRPLLQTLELTESMNNLLDVEANSLQHGDCDGTYCCERTREIVQENCDLKRKLSRTRKALEETVTQLSLANQRKKQVEKNICRQIHKTSQVLRKAKANLDSGSETDVYKQ